MSNFSSDFGNKTKNSPKKRFITIFNPLLGLERLTEKPVNRTEKVKNRTEPKPKMANFQKPNQTENRNH